MKTIITRDWKEEWVERMGLIVALSGDYRFKQLAKMKGDMAVRLSQQEVAELKECLRRRFTPSNGNDGCREATQSVRSAINA